MIISRLLYNVKLATVTATRNTRFKNRAKFSIEATFPRQRKRKLRIEFQQNNRINHKLSLITIIINDKLMKA